MAVTLPILFLMRLVVVVYVLSLLEPDVACGYVLAVLLFPMLLLGRPRMVVSFASHLAMFLKPCRWVTSGFAPLTLECLVNFFL
jgi:hypothetical protein